MKILYLARCCRFNITHPVCMLARKITKWNCACDRGYIDRFAISNPRCFTAYTDGLVMSRTECSIMLFTGASSADFVNMSKSTTGVFVALVGPNAFFPLNSACKKQAVVSHSSTESEIAALDTALRTEGLPLRSFWEAA
eukprot:7892-Pyramimonas_sp.AAC.1